MKRIFSLILSLCVALALTVPALAAAPAAPRLTDLEQVAHKEAVQLMVDLGVIRGKEDDTFDPKGSVDRATMSKMLYGILMGGADPTLFSPVDTGLSDIAGNWAEDYIKYCYSVGIITGKGDGTFDPNGVVNVASAAKMLLVTLGYDAFERGYASDPLWSDNIMRDAEELDLLEGITQYSFEPLTRDNAARMLYNTLFAYTHTPTYAIQELEKVIVGYTQNPTTLGLETLGLVRYQVQIGSVTGSAPPEISYLSLFPKAITITDSGGIIRQLRSGEAYIPIGPELQDSKATFYVKARYTLTENKVDIDKLTLEKIYSSRLTPTP